MSIENGDIVPSDVDENTTTAEYALPSQNCGADPHRSRGSLSHWPALFPGPQILQLAIPLHHWQGSETEKLTTQPASAKWASASPLRRPPCGAYTRPKHKDVNQCDAFQGKRIRICDQQIEENPPSELPWELGQPGKSQKQECSCRCDPHWDGEVSGGEGAKTLLRMSAVCLEIQQIIDDIGG